MIAMIISTCDIFIFDLDVDAKYRVAGCGLQVKRKFLYYGLNGTRMNADKDVLP